MHCLEGAGNGDRSSQRGTRSQSTTHTTPEIPFLEKLHYQPRVFVADSEIKKLHDAGMLDALNDLVLLEKASERMVQVVLILVPIPDHLQGNQRSRSFALREIQVRNRPRGDPPDAPIAANERAAKALGLATGGTGLPLLARTRLNPLGIRNGLEELLGLNLIATQYDMRPQALRLGRINMSRDE